MKQWDFRLWAATFVLPLAAYVIADTITFPGGASIEGEGLSSVVVAERFPVKLTAPSPGLLYQWEAPPGVTLSSHRGKEVSVTTAPPGKLEVSVFYATAVTNKDGGIVADEKTWTFKLVVGGIAPQPPPIPPDPPKPTPEPPIVNTSPFAEPGLRVLICFDPATLNAPEGAWMKGPTKTVRDWLNSHCVPDPTSKEKDGSGQPLKEWRLWPATENGQPTDVSLARKVFRDAWANKGPEKRNWIMIGDGVKGNGAGEPLPRSEAEALAILKKVGGE